MTKAEILFNGINVSIEELTALAVEHDANIDTSNYPIGVAYTGGNNLDAVYAGLLDIKQREGSQIVSIFSVARQVMEDVETTITVGYLD